MRETEQQTERARETERDRETETEGERESSVSVRFQKMDIHVVYLHPDLQP